MRIIRVYWYCLSLSIIYLAPAAALAGSAAGQSKSSPNVILMMADDLGWADPGFMGNKHIRTPALDQMAKDGLVFTRFYSAAPVCSPTRASCLTGRHPYRMGIYSANVGHLPEREITLQRLLSQRGYVTGHFGKWHLGTLTTTLKESNRGGPRGVKHFAPPWKRNFDVCFSTEAKVPTWNPMIHPKTGKSYGTNYWYENGKRATENLKGDDSRVIMDRAIPFIEEAAKKKTPFFAVIWFHTPHLPAVGGPEYLKKYAHVKSEKAKHYYACITAMDDQIGRLRQTLQELGISDNTIVCFCSDNGPEGRAGQLPGSAGILRGRKRSLYDGGIRVPGIIVWPNRIKGGKRTDIPAFTSDYFPTIVELLKLKLPSDRPIDGVSLVSLLDGKMKERPKKMAFESRGQRALIGNRYSLYKSKKKKAWELYDLIADPGQKNDIAGKHPEIVKKMREEHARWRESVQSSFDKLK